MENINKEKPVQRLSLRELSPMLLKTVRKYVQVLVFGAIFVGGGASFIGDKTDESKGGENRVLTSQDTKGIMDAVMGKVSELVAEAQAKGDSNFDLPGILQEQVKAEVCKPVNPTGESSSGVSSSCKLPGEFGYQDDTLANDTKENQIKAANVAEEKKLAQELRDEFNSERPVSGPQ